MGELKRIGHSVYIRRSLNSGFRPGTNVDFPRVSGQKSCVLLVAIEPVPHLLGDGSGASYLPESIHRVQIRRLYRLGCCIGNPVCPCNQAVGIPM